MGGVTQPVVDLMHVLDTNLNEWQACDTPHYCNVLANLASVTIQVITIIIIIMSVL